MKRRTAIAILLSLPCAAQAGPENWLNDALRQNRRRSAALDTASAADGLKQALEQGTRQAVSLLGRENGYFGNARVKIPLPEKLASLEKTLRKLGRGKAVDDFILSLNRAAEAAAPEAREIFLQVIRKMTVQDAVGIVRGPENAATAYFRRQSEAALKEKFHPIVAGATDRFGVTRRYKKLLGEAGPAAALLDMHRLDIDDYVTHKALDGLFLMVADEERRIRLDPLARSTELLRKVFGS